MAIAVTESIILKTMSTKFDARNRGTYVVVYRVKATSDADPDVGEQLDGRGFAIGALDATPHPLPAFGDYYDLRDQMGPLAIDRYSYAQDYDVKSVPGQRRMADIVVTYTPLGPGETEKNRQQKDVTLRKAEYWWAREAYQRPIEKVLNDQDEWIPFVNSAGTSFDRPPAREMTRGVLMATFPVASLEDAALLERTLSNAVNKDEWTFTNADTGETLTAPKRTALCRYVTSGRRITEPPATEEGDPQSYYMMEMAIAFANDGETWDVAALNEGFRHWAPEEVKDPENPDGPKITVMVERRAKILDKNGNETTERTAEPVLLAQDGTRLDSEIGNFTGDDGGPSGRAAPEVDFNDVLNPYFMDVA